jgi:hypothetical protein
VVLRATLGDRQEVNTFHYDLHDVTAEPANDPQTLADTFRDDVRSVWRQLYRPRWTLDPVLVVEEKDPQNPTDPRSAWTSGDPIPGTSSGTSVLLPSATCIVTSLLTDNIGRRFRGRNFWGGDATEGEQNDGAWQSSILDFINGTLLPAIPRQPDIQSGDSTSTANWCVYSRTQRAANLDPYASHITGVNTRTAVHWRRARAGI